MEEMLVNFPEYIRYLLRSKGVKLAYVSTCMGKPEGWLASRLASVRKHGDWELVNMLCATLPYCGIDVRMIPVSMCLTCGVIRLDMFCEADRPEIVKLVFQKFSKIESVTEDE